MNNFARRLRCRLAIAYRHARELAFELLVLGPLVLGTLAWISKRYLSILAPWVEAWAALDSEPISAALLGLVAVGAMIGGSLRELYAHETLDTLPIGEPMRLLLTLAYALARGALGGLLVALAIAMVGRAWPPLYALAWLLGIVTSLVLLSLGVAALGIRVPRLRLLWWLLPVLVALPAGQLLRQVVARSLEVGTGLDWQLWLALSLITLVGVVVYHLRWRRRDLERAAQVRRRGARRGLLAGLTRLLPSRLSSPALRALVRRDLRLVARRFSPAVIGSWIATVLALLSMGLVAFDARLSSDAIQRAMVIAGTLAVLSSVAIVPFLLRAQLPMFWIEKALGAPRDDIWRAKAVVAIAVALPPLVIGLGLILALCPGTLGGVAIAALQLLASGLIMASVIGLASFEIAATPIVGLVFGAMISSALMLLILFYPTWSALWLAGFVILAQKLIERAPRRVYFTEVLS